MVALSAAGELWVVWASALAMLLYLVPWIVEPFDFAGPWWERILSIWRDWVKGYYYFLAVP